MSMLIPGILLLAYYAYKTEKLTRSGAVTAMIVGVAIAYGLGLEGLFVLGLFFFSSSYLSSFKKESKEEEINEKGSRRDAMQVLANGGIAALCAMMYKLDPSSIWILGFLGSIAAATADTWASEIGPLSRRRPWHIRTWQHVEKGTSGAISIRGTLAAIVGSLVIALTSLLFFDFGSLVLAFVVLITIAGFLGNCFDTVLGAYGQVTYRCHICGMETERLSHCMQPTEQIKGWKWVNNDIVNITCTFVGALIAIMTSWSAF
ncbi:DUF92 domain-containing protein [Bacillus suaedae]|uniref:DUF92 domain-containing protein n=1 Tax=Halalkalibacter suaedae TaxID=2822140 RepID=A0A940WR98_9BACI|nr:DUF92 domain-containing protein [Bacillus suaedae]MBP3951244.1 DUF92 domain-containing protein [Bacillus suaedae]